MERPPLKKYTITGEEMWQIAIWSEMQGGNKSFSHRINGLLDEIVRRYEK